MRPYIRRSLLAISTLGAGLAACADNSDNGVAPTIETAKYVPSLGVNLAASTRLPSGVYYRDITTGTGAEAANGTQMSVRYTGWLVNGTQFDSNVNGAPFEFRLGNREVIEGWDVGLVGMKVGGRRQLIIPPALGYGAAGEPPAIPANSILIFNVDLLAAQ